MSQLCRVPERGFTLVEALVALVVVAMAMEVVVRSAATGLAAAHRERATLEAIARAQSHLAELRDPLAPGRVSGPDGGGYDYLLQVRPLAELPPLRGLRLSGGVQPMNTVLYQVDVVISWRDGTRVHSMSLSRQVVGAVRP